MRSVLFGVKRDDWCLGPPIGTGDEHGEIADGAPIDASGVLVDGTPVNGPQAQREALASRPNAFVGTVTENLLIYALGRGLQPSDMQVVRQIVRTSAPDRYRFMDLIAGIVQSRPFQMRVRVPGTGSPATPTTRTD